MNIERRYVPFQAEIRAQEDAPPRLVGHAAVYDTPSEEMWGFTERIAPGAFDDVLGDDVRLLVEHSGLALARTKSKTLTLGQDDDGLTYDATLDPANPRVPEVLSVVGRGDVDQMSFGFTVGEDSFETKDGRNIRTITKVKRLWDVSLVTFPAYPDGTSAEVRRLAALLTEVREGKVLSEGNAKRLKEAIKGLLGVLEAAGVSLEDEAEAVAEAVAEEKALPTALIHRRRRLALYGLLCDRDATLTNRQHVPQ